MEKSNKQLILSKLTELFVTKNKKLENVTARVWLTHLCALEYNAKSIIGGIQRMILKDDDFPTVSKIIVCVKEENEVLTLIDDVDKTLLRMDEKYQLEDKS